MSYVVGSRILVDPPGCRDGNLHHVHGRHGVLLHHSGMRMHEGERPQLIVTEVAARDLTRRGLLARRQSDDSRCIPVIVLTNSGWEQARALGAAAETRGSCRHCPLRPSSPGVNLAL
jgi:hypothetical protein